MKALRSPLLAAVLLLAPIAAAGQARVEAHPALPESDRVRLAEAFRLAEALGDTLWPGWSGTPFPVLLVTAEHEFLIGHPEPVEGFAPLGYDPLLRSEVHARAATFPPRLAAAFPAVSARPTVVVGQAELREESSTAWVLTVLHEHFHQYQMSRPDYAQRVAALELARGDDTGMWMLNFPFPYDSAAVQARFAELARSLDEALDAPDDGARSAGIAAFRASLQTLESAVAEDARRYLAFQLWQEGIARYTEYRMARLAATRYTPSPDFLALADYRPFAERADALRRAIHEQLRAPDLAGRRRTAFYALGAGFGLLLDAAAPSWKSRYLGEPFALGAYLPAPAASPAR